MLNGLVQNAPERVEYAAVLTELTPVFCNLPPLVVSIDGRSGSGKTTLGRFLAWRFNVTLMETDNFIDEERAGFRYRCDDVKAVIHSRLARGSPIIVEGMLALRLLSDIGCKPAFHIRVVCPEVDSEVFDEAWKEYLKEFGSVECSHMHLTLPVLDKDPH